jgi:hypothetical protein
MKYEIDIERKVLASTSSTADVRNALAGAKWVHTDPSVRAGHELYSDVLVLTDRSL